MDMRAAVLRGTEPLGVEQLTLDGPEAGEVLVRIAACGVCHSDLHVINRIRGTGSVAPVVLGHEAAGVVEAVGPGVRSLRQGDHVILAFHPACGACFQCDSGRPQLCERPDNPERSMRGPRPRLSAGGQPVQQGVGIGGFAEYAVMPERGVVKVRDDAPLDVIALIGCGVTTGVGAVINAAKVEPGSDVAVIGLGGVGLNIVQGARLAGARRIIAVDVVDDKLKTAERFGATHLVNGGTTDPVAEVQAITGGRLDYAFEAIGLAKTVSQAFAMVRPGGTAVVVGLVSEPVTVPGFDFLREKRLIGTIYGSASIHVDIPRLVDLYMDGKLLLDELVSRRRPLAEVNEAFADMEGGLVARTVLDPHA